MKDENNMLCKPSENSITVNILGVDFEIEIKMTEDKTDYDIIKATIGNQDCTDLLDWIGGLYYDSVEEAFQELKQELKQWRRI